MRNWLAMTLLVAFGLFACTTTNRGSSDLSGKVVLDGQTLPANTLVTIVGPTPDTATLGADGTYHFTKLLVGTYAVVVEMPSTTEARLIKEVTVGKSAATAEDIVFHPLGGITGVATLGSATGNAGIVVAVAGTSSLAITDDAGHFTLTGVPSGAHDVYATLAGHGSAHASGVVVPYQTSVDAGTLTLTTQGAAGAIHGTVAITGATSAAGVSVTLTGPISLTTTTAADGKYAFTGLADGVYLITAASAVTVPGSASRSATVAAGNDVTGVDFTFAGQVTRAGSIAGTVAFAGGTVTGVTLTLSGAVSSATHPAADGTFSFASLPDGAYLLTATAAAATPPSSVLALTVAGGQAVTGANFSFLPSTATGSIAGTVTLAGAASSAGVVLTLTGPVNASVTSAANGTYSFPALPNGSYLVTANATSSLPATLSRGATVTAGAAVAGVDFALVPVGSLKGHITLTAAALGGATVALGGTQQSAVTLADGSYQIDDVPAGTYTVTVLATGTRPGTATATVVRGQQATTDVDLVPAGGQARLRGVIRVVGVGPVAGVTVTATGQTTSGSAVTDAQGNYQIDNLDTGIYTLVADDGHGDVETLGTVLAVTNTDGLFLSNGTLSPLAPLELQHDTRLLSVPDARLAAVADPSVGKALVLVNGLNCSTNVGGAVAQPRSQLAQGRINQSCLWGLEEVDAVGGATLLTAVNVDENTPLFAPTSHIPLWVTRGYVGDYYGALHAYVGGHDEVISTNLYNYGSPQLAFSPDGNTVVYAEGSYYYTLMATDLRTGVQHQLGTTVGSQPNFNFIHFLSNTRLAYVTSDTYANSLFVSDVDGTNRVTVYGYVSDVLGYDAANTYAIVASTSEGTEYAAAALDGTFQGHLTYNSVRYLNPTSLLVQDADANLLTLSVQVADGGGNYFATQEDALTPPNYQPGANIYWVTVTGDGKEMAYTSYTATTGVTSLVTMAVSPGATPQITGLDTTSLYAVQFGGARLVVADQSIGNLTQFGVLTWDAAGTPTVTGLEGTQVSPGNLTVDESGTTLAYQVIDTDGGTPSNVVVQAPDATGTLTRHDLGVVSGPQYTFSPDGKHLAVIDGQTRALTVNTFPAATSNTLTGIQAGYVQFVGSNRMLVGAQGTTGNALLYVATNTGATPTLVSSNQSQFLMASGNQVLFAEDYDSNTGSASTKSLNLTTLQTTPLVSLAVDGNFLTPSTAIIIRQGTPAPYQFQDGVYLPPLP